MVQINLGRNALCDVSARNDVLFEVHHLRDFVMCAIFIMSFSKNEKYIKAVALMLFDVCYPDIIM